MKKIKCEKCGSFVLGNSQSFDSLAMINGYVRTSTGYICSECFQPVKKPVKTVIKRQYYKRGENDE